MKYTFDLFNGEKSPSREFVEWVPQWWYYASGLPIEKGRLADGREWLLAGWVFSEEKVEDIINSIQRKGIAPLFETGGQFLLAICSRAERRVDISRDRTGILPVVYAKGRNGIVLSLWIDNVVNLSGSARIPSKGMREQWAIFRKTFPPYTPVDSISSLSGRHSLSIRDGNIALREHSINTNAEPRYRNLASASDELGEILSQSVAKSVKNQKHLCALLSGGNDSSLLVALIRRYYPGNLRTAFVTFEDNPRDYGEYARQVANKFETHHITLRLTSNDYVENWAETISILQSPLHHPNTIGRFLALQELSGTTDVMISGGGADTVFGGPYWPPLLALSFVGKLLPYSMRDFSLQLSKNMSEPSFLKIPAAKALQAIGTPIEEYVHSESAFTDKETAELVFGNGIWDKAMNALKAKVGENTLRGLFPLHLFDSLPFAIGTEVRLGLAQEIISFFPFLDSKLLFSCLKLPMRLRYHYSTKKAALKRYCLNYFDRDFVYKPKEGFGVPLGKWYTKSEFKPYLYLPLEERSLRRGWWNERELRRIVDLHKCGKGTDKSAEAIPWITTNLELWARICIDGDSPNLYK